MTTYRQTMSTALETVRIIQEGVILERKLSDTEIKRREDIAQDLPDSDFKDRYGARWKEVKMAVATKQAKIESLNPKEEISEGPVGFSPVMIKKLKKAYAGLKRVDPTSPAGKRMPEILDKMDKDQLIQIVKADINFLSLLAVNRLIRDHGMRADAIRKLREDCEIDLVDSRQLKDKKKEMMVKPPGKGEGVIVIDKKDWIKYKKKGYVQAEETDLDEGYLELEFKDKRKAEQAYKYINNKIWAGGNPPYDDFNQEGNTLQIDTDGNLNRRNQMLKDLKALPRDLQFKVVVNEEVDLDEAKYEIYHKDFSSAMQHAYKAAKKMYGITIDPKEIDDKVATGPKKPSSGKTNKYRLKGDKGGVQIQVANLDNKKYELNMYKEDVEIDEKFDVKTAATKKGRIKVSSFNNLEDAEKYLAVMQRQGHKGIISKGGKPVNEDVDLDEAPWDSSKTHSPNKQTANVKKLKDKKGPVFKGTPTQIKKQMKDWKKKHDKVKIGEGKISDKLISIGDDLAKLVKQGGMDKRTYQSAQDYIEAGDFKGVSKFAMRQDTEPRDNIIDIVAKHLGKKQAMKIFPVKFFENTIEAYEFGTDEYRKYLEDLTPMEGAKQDAMRAMKKDKDLGQKKDSADVDDHASDADRKAASKNVFSQLLKSIDSGGKTDVVFRDKKKVKVSAVIAKQVIKKSQSFRRPAEKLTFQKKIQISYKDLLKALKEDNNKPLTILDRIDDKITKIKERKNG